jgi:hypothetical protein
MIKVGQTIFELEGWEWLGSRFLIKEMQHDGRGYSSQWSCYLSMKEIEDEDEAYKIGESLRGIFGHYGRIDLSLDQLRRIKSIVEEKKETNESSTN